LPASYFIPFLFEGNALHRTGICCFLAIAGVAFVRPDDMRFSVFTDLKNLRTHLLACGASFTSIDVHYRLWHTLSSFSFKYSIPSPETPG